MIGQAVKTIDAASLVTSNCPFVITLNDTASVWTDSSTVQIASTRQDDFTLKVTFTSVLGSETTKDLVIVHCGNEVVTANNVHPFLSKIHGVSKTSNATLDMNELFSVDKQDCAIDWGKTLIQQSKTINDLI